MDELCFTAILCFVSQRARESETIVHFIDKLDAPIEHTRVGMSRDFVPPTELTSADFESTFTSQLQNTPVMEALRKERYKSLGRALLQACKAKDDAAILTVYRELWTPFRDLVATAIRLMQAVALYETDPDPKQFRTYLTRLDTQYDEDMEAQDLFEKEAIADEVRNELKQRISSGLEANDLLKGAQSVYR